MMPSITSHISRFLGLASAAVGLLCIATLLSGCFWFTSRRRGDELEARNTELTKRIETLEKQLETDRAEYTKLIQKAQNNVTELEEVLARATRAAADYAAETDSFQEHLAKLEGSIAELRVSLRKADGRAANRENDIRDRMELIAAKVGLDPPLDPADIPQDRQKHLDVAHQARDKGDFGKARSFYRAFIERYPTDESLDDVQLAIGRTYQKQARWAQALTALNVIVERYPESDLMGETLYTMAESLYNMRSCNDAITLLQAVLQRYRDEALVSRARSKLRQVQRAKRRGCRP